MSEQELKKVINALHIETYNVADGDVIHIKVAPNSVKPATLKPIFESIQKKFPNNKVLVSETTIKLDVIKSSTSSDLVCCLNCKNFYNEGAVAYCRNRTNCDFTEYNKNKINSCRPNYIKKS